MRPDLSGQRKRVAKRRGDETNESIFGKSEDVGIRELSDNSSNVRADVGIRAPCPLSQQSLVSAPSEESKVAQPVGARLRPGGVGMFALADAEVVRGARIDMQLRRDAGSF